MSENIIGPRQEGITDGQSSGYTSEEKVGKARGEGDTTIATGDHPDAPIESGKKEGLKTWLYVLASFFLFVNAW
jgi:hypothetical protein